MMVRKACVIMCLIAATLPSAAASGEDAFTVKGPVVYPTDATTSAGLRLLLIHNAPTLKGAEILTTHATIHEHRATFLGSSVSPLPSTPYIQRDLSVRNYTVTNSTIRILTGWNTESYLGLVAGDGSLLTVQGPTTFEPREASAIGNAAMTNGDDPRSIHFNHTIRGAHFHQSGTGRIEYHGPGHAKIRGGTVEVQTPDETRRHETGNQQTGPAEATITWLFIELHGPATLRIPNAPFQAAAEEATARWHGTARFTPTAGQLHTREGTHTPPGGIVELEGDFRAHMTPEGATASLRLSGELTSSTLLLTPAPHGAHEGQARSALLLIVAVAVGASGSALIGIPILRRRHRRQVEAQGPFTLEEYEALINEYLARKEWRRALGYVRLARRVAPTSGRLAMAEGDCLAGLGDHATAARLYEEADALLSDGEAAMQLARLLKENGRPPREVERWLQRALGKTPSLVADIEDEFPELKKRPDWKARLRKAWRIYEGEWTGRR